MGNTGRTALGPLGHRPKKNLPGPLGQSVQNLGIGGGVGKQGRGNQHPYRQYGPDTEIQYRPRKPHGLAKPSRILSKRRPIRNFSIDPTSSIRTSIADAIFADAISETPTKSLEKSKGLKKVLTDTFGRPFGFSFRDILDTPRREAWEDFLFSAWREGDCSPPLSFDIKRQRLRIIGSPSHLL